SKNYLHRQTFSVTCTKRINGHLSPVCVVAHIACIIPTSYSTGGCTWSTCSSCSMVKSLGTSFRLLIFIKREKRKRFPFVSIPNFFAADRQPTARRSAR